MPDITTIFDLAQMAKGTRKGDHTIFRCSSRNCACEIVEGACTIKSVAEAVLGKR